MDGKTRRLLVEATFLAAALWLLDGPAQARAAAPTAGLLLLCSEASSQAGTAVPGQVSGQVPGQVPGSKPRPEPTAAVPGPVPLDRAVATVNGQVILASDLDEEMRLTLLQPGLRARELSPEKALERLISRALILQQIRQENPVPEKPVPEKRGQEGDPGTAGKSSSLRPTDAEVDAQILQLRHGLPLCERRDCKSDNGWRQFLAANGLTTEQVVDYWRQRIEILRFIEQRFRSGIQIFPEEIAKYYKETLLPQYANPKSAPTLAEVSERIQEVLLQQRVNSLFTEWLKSLNQQGSVEILDPSLQTAESAEGSR